MRLDEAKVILEENGYKLEESISNDIFSYIGLLFGTWIGIKTIGEIICSSANTSYLKNIIKIIETNKDELVQILYFSLTPKDKKDNLYSYKRKNNDIKWTLNDIDLDKKDYGWNTTIQEKLNLKLKDLDYDKLKFIIKQSMITNKDGTTFKGWYVDNLSGGDSITRSYLDYILNLYTDILWEALHPEDSDVSDRLKDNINEYKKLTTLKAKFKNIWNNLKYLYKE